MRRLGIFVGVAWLAGCGTTIKYAETNSPPRFMTPRPESQVEVFSTGTPNRPFLEVGIMSARQSSQYSHDDMADIIAAMRKRAATLGCDALVIVSSDKTVGGGSNQYGGSVHTLDGFRGACIVYTDGAAPANAAAPSADLAGKTEPSAEKPKQSAAGAPAGAAGFEFAQSIQTAEQLCSGANHTWTVLNASRYSCSGTPSDTGLRARARLGYCEGRLCEINIEAVSKGNSSSWQDAFDQVRELLAQKYGEPKRLESEIPQECAGAPLATCIAEQRAKLQASWWWAAGERIILGLVPSDKGGEAMLRITYTKWPLDPPKPSGGAL